VRAFACPNCGQLVFFENSECLRCHTPLGFDPDSLDLAAVTDGRARCANANLAACNWLVPAARAGALCRSCDLTRTRPPDSDADGLAGFADVEHAKRRLVFQLLELGLPLDGLRFDLLSSRDRRVTIGHRDGVITIDLAESDDAHRSRVREALGEPYRTILGHLRHEVGHFYWVVLIEQAGRVEEWRMRFGDERYDYGAALQRHYRQGARPDWQDHHASAYAASHPWEDWAETFAHYLHIRDAVEAAADYGVHVRGPAAVKWPTEDLSAVPVADAEDYPFETVLAEWLPLTYALNAINRSMGKEDLYPFVLANEVVGKLAYVHDLVRRRG